MPTLDATIDLLRALGDPTRVRLLALLAFEALTVAELTRVTRLSQSRVSSHLARLRDAGFVRDRRDGGSSWYALDQSGMPEEAARLWKLARASTDDPLLVQDAERLAEVLAERDGHGSWADSVAGSMARHYSPGRSWEAMLRGLMGLVSLGRVLDVASGDGAIAELLASRSEAVVCLDRSPRVIEAGMARLGGVPNLAFQCGDMHELPFADASFDHVLLMNALQYASDPGRVLREAARVLAPGGALVGATVRRHAHRDVVAAYDHVNLGFEPAELQLLVEAAGLRVRLCACTSRERRPPHFEVLTFHAVVPEPRSAG